MAIGGDIGESNLTYEGEPVADCCKDAAVMSCLTAASTTQMAIGELEGIGRHKQKVRRASSFKDLIDTVRKDLGDEAAEELAARLASIVSGFEPAPAAEPPAAEPPQPAPEVTIP